MIDFQRTASANQFQLYQCPVVPATADALREYGVLIDHFEDLPEHSGEDKDSCVYNFWWKGNLFYHENETTGRVLHTGTSMLGGSDDTLLSRENVHIWEVFSLENAHQLFYPLRGEDYILPLGGVGKDAHPENFTAFYVSGGRGVYLHPSIWCNGIIPLTERASFYHQINGTTVYSSKNFSKELNSLLTVPLQQIKEQFYE